MGAADGPDKRIGFTAMTFHKITRDAHLGTMATLEEDRLGNAPGETNACAIRCLHALNDPLDTAHSGGGHLLVLFTCSRVLALEECEA